LEVELVNINSAMMMIYLLQAFHHLIKSPVKKMGNQTVTLRLFKRQTLSGDKLWKDLERPVSKMTVIWEKV